MPAEKEKKTKKVAARSGKTKTAFIPEAGDEMLGLRKSREEMLSELSGWLGHEEAKALREAAAPSRQVRRGDWK